MLIVFNQMISLFLLMLTGYLANRSGVIDKTFESKVSRFIVNISLPATILNAVTGSDMAHDQEMLPIFVAAVSIFLVAHVICHFIQKTIRWYLENKSWWEHIISGDYQNYYERMYGNR